jgi:hypothetical protein
MAHMAQDDGTGHARSHPGRKQTGRHARADDKGTMWMSIGLVSEFATIVVVGLLVYFVLTHG